MDKKIYLFRHGITDANHKNLLVGATDVPLAEEGREQSRAMRGIIRKINPGAVYCSPMMRTEETATIAMNGAGPDIEMDDNIRECDFGQWEMMSWEEAWNNDKKMALKWSRGDEDFRFPEGESLAGFLNRIAKFHELLADEDEERVVVFTHGGVIGQLLCRLLDVPANRHMIFKLPPASMTIIDFHDNVGVLSGICPPSIYIKE